MTWRVDLSWSLEKYGYTMMAIDIGTGDKSVHLSELQFTKVDNPASHPGRGTMLKPVFIQDRGFIQAIVDAAWHEGIRPEALQADASEIGATKRHLEDMRTIVAEKMKVPLLMRVK